MKKKILFITFWYPSDNEPYKGIFIREYARSLHLNGHQLTVFAFNIKYGKSIFHLEKYIYKDNSGFDTYTLTLSSILWKFLYFINPLLNLIAFRFIKKNILNHFVPDIIHSHVINPAGVIGQYLSKKINKPQIITEHWSEIDPFFKVAPFGRMALRAYNDASYVTAVSEYLKGKISKYVKNSDKIKVVPNIINFNFKCEPHLSANKIEFTSVGKWEKPKNPQLVYEALCEFAKTSNKPVIFNLVGDGSLTESFIDKKNSPNFEMITHGVLSSYQIADLLQQTHYFLHCSGDETFSIVIAEALSCGVPVLASNKGAIPELVNSTNGMVCENIMTEWIENLKKITLLEYDRKAISNAVIGRFTNDVVVDKFNLLYNTLK